MNSIDAAEIAEGLIILRSPERAEADVVFIHGLGGHPYKTWACPRRKKIPAAGIRPSRQNQPSSDTASEPRDKPGLFRRLFAKIGCDDGDKAGAADEEPSRPLTPDSLPPPDETHENKKVYWPREILAREDHCRNMRILAYGYDSKNNLFAHAKDLLYALQREKPARRPIIFVAHSLGGLLVKEVLRRSEASEEVEFKDIVKSTKGGSSGMSDLGETVRSIASAILRVDSTAALLRALGTDSPELELGRESFTTLWRKYVFRVKTFQEAWGISGVNAGPLNAKVVPDVSSTLDDPKEHAETISANHMNMCRFDSRLDAGYRKVSLELRSMILSARVVPLINEDGKGFLQSLAFAEMDNRRGNIQRALDETCGWLYSTTKYDEWITGTNVAENHGLLWIKGKPGSGKSTLMKDAVRRAEEQYAGTQTTTAAFFFNARGTGQLGKTPLGLYRSLLYQVLRQDSLALGHLAPMFRQKSMFQPSVTWHQEELQDFLSRVFATSEYRPAVLLIDAMDECKDDEVRDLVRFFKNLSKKAFEAGADLKICLSSRHYPHISIDGCPEVVDEDHNRPDILRYIVAEAEDNRPIADLKIEIFERSSGVFLWVVLAIAMLRKHGRGNIEPLRQSQIHQALAFGGTRYPSLAEWDDSVDYLETREKIHEMIIDLSKGFLEHAPSSSTIREFFLSGDGFRLLHFNPTSIVGSGHSMMAICFANYLEIEELRTGAPNSAKVGAYDPGISLLDYICTHIFDHIEAAEVQGTSQEAILRRLSDDACELLLRMDKSPFKTKYEAGSTILVAAIDFGVLKTADRILKMGFSVNQPTATPLKYALHTAVSGPRNDPHKQPPQIEMVRLLLRNGADVSMRNQYKQTALHIAAVKNPDMLNLILEKKPNVNAQDVDGETPLHRAVHSFQYWQQVEILLKHGARLDLLDKQGRTALDVARSSVFLRDVQKGSAEVFRLMEEHAAKLGYGK
ncbi:hypothetical protein B0H66DRAFT_582413 [Apodospora peruviana]|uniref:Nephrocystin 3-like N-terminal domain-containing protein n=1 Tax=Apodospora peruviana TaxID=516989 RepID=A0AAE0M522_9PEZI|nr:hypothetical protein B0H66DRAFT_582413 [Apodospora peruviana]